MFNLDELIYDCANTFFCRLIKPNLSFTSVHELTEEEINILIDHFNIKGIILDVDDTLRYNMEEISTVTLKWVDMLASKLKVVVVSNGIDKKVESLLNRRKINYISMALKPFRKNFLKACNMIGLNPKEVAVVGDDLIADIYGGNRNDMFTIWISKKKIIT